MKTGVIIGRFQTPYLHEGHQKLFDTAFVENDLVFVFIGFAQGEARDERNPYTYSERCAMVNKAYPKALIGALQDVPENDETWSRELDAYLEQLVNPTLYGGRDSFHSHYKGRFPYREIESIPDVSATKIREQLKNKQND